MPRVLIVDDEMLLPFVLRTQLEARGWEVAGTARNGRAAVEFCREQLPEVVLMDIRMPVMDGLEATRLIMAENPTCIMVMTAYAAEDTAAQAEAAGAMAYLTKPTSADEIQEAYGPAEERFREFLALRAEASDAADALATRRLVEAAKEILSARTGASAEDAFRRLQQLAAAQGSTLRAAAEAILASART